MKDECYICGQPAATEGLVEGARVFLCGNCMGYGTPIATNRPIPSKYPQKTSSSGSLYPSTFTASKPSGTPFHHDIIPVPNYGEVLKNAREKMNLTRKQLGETLFISENVIERIEHEQLKPDLKTAQKLEQFLKIKIVEEELAGKVDDAEKELKEMRKQNKGSGNLTAGDVIEIKTRKK